LIFDIKPKHLMITFSQLVRPASEVEVIHGN
jgi:hypothetical protein